MKVLVICDNPTVQVADFDGGVVLDLVAHFLGIAMHHNDNADPKAIAALEVIPSAEEA